MKKIALAAVIALTASSPALAYADTITVQENGRTKIIEAPRHFEPLITGATSFVMPGVGQAVNDEYLKGALHLASFGVAAGGFSYAATYQSELLIPTLGAALLVMGYSAWDASQVTSRRNAEREALLAPYR